MSKYTTQVRFICENAAGLTESTGFNGVNQVIQQAIPKVFDFDFPIYDESYRNVLCTKILKHYYTREIGAETVGLWKLWLDTRLNEIMPYYNLLYKSALLDFNPLYDVDLRTTHSKQNDGTTNTQNSGSTNDTNTSDKTYTNNYEQNKSSTGEITEERSGQKNSEGGYVKNISTTGSVNDNREITKEGSNTDTRDIEKSASNSGSSNSTTNDEHNSTRNTEVNSTTSDSGTEKTTTQNESSGTKRDMYSDTPQGALDNIENETYLTNARKVTDAANSEQVKNNEFEKTGVQLDNSVEDISETTKTTNTEETSGESSQTIKDILSGEQTESVNDKTVRSTDESVEDSFDSNSSESVTDNVNKTSTDSGNIKGNTASDEKVTGSYQRTEEKTGSTVMASTEEYLQTVQGKSGSGSYSKMLMEYRATFINIDMMVIDELADLFINLW